MPASMPRASGRPCAPVHFLALASLQERAGGEVRGRGTWRGALKAHRWAWPELPLRACIWRLAAAQQALSCLSLHAPKRLATIAAASTTTAWACAGRLGPSSTRRAPSAPGCCGSQSSRAALYPALRVPRPAWRSSARRTARAACTPPQAPSPTLSPPPCAPRPGWRSSTRRTACAACTPPTSSSARGCSSSPNSAPGGQGRGSAGQLAEVHGAGGPAAPGRCAPPPAPAELTAAAPPPPGV